MTYIFLKKLTNQIARNLNTRFWLAETRNVQSSVMCTRDVTMQNLYIEVTCLGTQLYLQYYFYNIGLLKGSLGWSLQLPHLILQVILFPMSYWSALYSHHSQICGWLKVRACENGQEIFSQWRTMYVTFDPWCNRQCFDVCSNGFYYLFHPLQKATFLE